MPKIKKSGEAVKRLDQLATRQTNCTSRHKGSTGGGGGGRGQTFKRLGKLSNGCTYWHQIWYTSADSPGNGHRVNTIRPTVLQGHFGGEGLGGHKFKCLGTLPNGWTNWHQSWYKSADSPGNGHRLNTIRPSIRFRGSQIQKSGKAVKQLLYRLAPHLVHVCGFVGGMDIG